MKKLVLVSGPSGAGKTTVMNALMENELLSFTTRARREHERDGVDYHFISQEEFEALASRDELGESVEYLGNRYGLTKREIEGKLAMGDAYAVVEFEGFKQLLEKEYDVVSIFLYTSEESVLQRLMERGETESVIKARMQNYQKEMATRGHYQYVIRNNDGRFDETVSIVRSILRSEGVELPGC